MDGEADLPFRFADDLDADSSGLGDALAGVARIGDGELDDRPSAPRSAQQGRRAVAVLHSGGMRMQHQRTALGVHDGVALAP